MNTTDKMKTQTLKNDAIAIDRKIIDTNSEINKEYNSIQLACLCARTTKDKQYRAGFNHNIATALNRINKLEKQKAVFQKGYELITNKY